MAQDEAHVSVGGMLDLGKVKQNSAIIMIRKIKVLIARRVVREEESTMEDKL